MNGPICRVLRSTWFLASALDPARTRAEREHAWRLHEREAWFEAVITRGLPIMLVPAEHIGEVRKLIFERHEGGLSGFQARP